MFQSIRFCIGNQTIEVNGETYSLGELTTELLNLPREDFSKITEHRKKTESLISEYEENASESIWDALCDHVSQLDKLLCRNPTLRVLLEADPIPKEVLADESMRTLCISNFRSYAILIEDIASFSGTIRRFIDERLSLLKKLDSENYAAALCDFLYSHGAHHRIANPISGTGLFTNVDTVNVRYIPRETFEGSNEYKIYEYYEVSSLQAFLKADFYKALCSGFIIRRCEYCKHYFLLKKAYHTKYCDRPAPNDPKHTCAQLGYHRNGIKELTADNPKAQSLHRCYLRIDKDYSRGIISEDEKKLLYRKAQDLYHEASIRSGTSNEAFEETLASKNLYALCNVERVTAPRGRPKKKI